MEQNTTVVETITHHYIIYIFIGHKAQLTNVEMAKAVVASTTFPTHGLSKSERLLQNLHAH